MAGKSDGRNAPLRFVFVSSLDYSAPSAPTNRHLGLADALTRQGHSVGFLLLGRADLQALRGRHREFAWWDLGARSMVARLMGTRADRIRGWGHPSQRIRQSGPTDAVLCLDRDPIVLERSRALARRLGASFLHEITEYPDVVRPSGWYGALHLAAFNRRHLPRMDGVVVISRGLLDYVTSRTPSSVDKLLLPIFVDLGRFPNQLVESQTAVRDGCLSVGYAGSLDPSKDGVDLLIQALAVARSRIPSDRRIMLRVWGSGPQLEELVTLAEDLGLGGDVHFEGVVPRELIPSRFAEVDALALPRPVSRQASGGFPTKLGEYLASGRPVVATSTSDIGRYLEDGVSAFLVPPDDIDALAHALVTLVEDPELAQAVGAQGQCVAADSFSSDAAAWKLAKFVHSLEDGD